MSVKCTLSDNNTYFQQPGRTSLDKLKAILGFIPFFVKFELDLSMLYDCLLIDFNFTHSQILKKD